MDGAIYQKWIEDIDALSEAQREEVQKILAGRSSEAEVIAAVEGRLLADRVCPLCQRQGVVCRGRANGLRRFSCAGCGKTFNALTGTPLANLHYKGRWFALRPVAERGELVRTSAARCDVAVSTAFRWRHRFLRAITTDTAPLGGIVEADETYVLEVTRDRAPGKMPPRGSPMPRSRSASPASAAAKPRGAACPVSRCRSWWPPTVPAPRSAPSCRRSTPTPCKDSPGPGARQGHPSWSPMAHRSIHLARRR